MSGWLWFVLYAIAMAGVALWLQWREGDDTTFAELQGMLLGAWAVLPAYYSWLAAKRAWEWYRAVDSGVVLRGRKDRP